MGIFKTNEADKQRKEEKQKSIANMIITTAFTLDKPFETIGLVTTVVEVSATDYSSLIYKLKETALEKGADAIIGFHVMQVQSPFLKLLNLTAYGTAVKYKKEENAGA